MEDLSNEFCFYLITKQTRHSDELIHRAYAQLLDNGILNYIVDTNLRKSLLFKAQSLRAEGVI